MNARRIFHQLRQRVDVSALELLQAAPFEHLAGQVVHERQFLQHLLRRGRRPRLARPAQRRQLQLGKEHFPELLRRIDVERLAGEGVNARRPRVELLFDPRALGRQRRRVHADAGPLDVHEHGDQR
jgi:hypothetical protein